MHDSSQSRFMFIEGNCMCYNCREREGVNTVLLLFCPFALSLPPEVTTHDVLM